jgi:tetraacyldisaccharide 4'-kinase
VPPDEPRWWYEPAPTVAAYLLRPLGWGYGAVAMQRVHRSMPYHCRLPVICIGNFTAGGTGKTPLALEIARLCRGLELTPVFLTRGHGGSERGPRSVEPATDNARAVGDEALLLAAAAPTFIARDRARGARAIEAAVDGQTLAADVIIMDDGLQNPQLAKSLTLAVVDARRGIGNGLVIPAGPLRAPLAFQAGLTDAVVVNHGARVVEAQLPLVLASLPRLDATVVATGDTAWLADRPFVAFAGIGNPQRFFDLVESLGGRIAERIVFADHQPMTEADARRILALADRANAAIVTTAKDHVRLSGTGDAISQLRSAAQPLPIGIVWSASQEVRMIALLRRALAR